MADSALDACRGYASSALSTVLMYPLRDLVKHHTLQSVGGALRPEFFRQRWRGMLQHPSQPLLIALPWGALYAVGSTTTSSPLFFGLGAALFAAGKLFVRNTAVRMSMTNRRRDAALFPSYSQCWIEGTKRFGVFSWVAGWSPVFAVSILWHALALHQLAGAESAPRSFAGDALVAFRVHFFLGLLTQPLRNVTRSAMPRAAAHTVPTLRSFYSGEVALWREAIGVLRSVPRSDVGPRFLVHGAVRDALKGSLPFALTYATFRLLGGQLRCADGGRRHLGGGWRRWRAPQ